MSQCVEYDLTAITFKLITLKYCLSPDKYILDLSVKTFALHSLLTACTMCFTIQHIMLSKHSVSYTKE